MFQVTYQHKRCFDFGKDNPKKGSPDIDDLYAWSREYKWFDVDLDRFGFKAREGWEVNPRGGCTVCLILEGDTLIGMGEAVCSYSQNFSYKEGRRIARNRAIDDARIYGFFEELKEEGLEKEYGEDLEGRADLVWSDDFEEGE